MSFLSTTSSAGSLGFSLISIVLMLGLLYLFMLRPQQKKEKKATEMRNSIEVGDGVTTIGGVIGRVASIKEDSFVIETGADRVKLRFKRWAIQEVEKLTIDSTADKSKDKAGQDTKGTKSTSK